MSVLVTVVGARGAADLELDDTRPIGGLLEGIAAALCEPSPVADLRTSGGGPLAASATLAEAGVLDGHRLILVPRADGRTDTSPQPPETKRAARAPDGGDTPDRDDGPGPAVLACYLALDTSDSMVGPALEALNVELARLIDAVRADARLADVCRLAVVTFDEEARVHLQLTPVAELGRPPRFAATRPSTNYEAAFRLLRRLITEDLAGLRASGRRPLRPLVWLLTDGRPTRGYWPSAHTELTESSWPDAPDVVAFGFGDVAPLALRRIGTAGAYLPASAPGLPLGGPAGMLSTLMEFLQQALRRSSSAAAASAPGRQDDRPPVTASRPASDRAQTGWRSLDEVLR